MTFLVIVPHRHHLHPLRRSTWWFGLSSVLLNSAKNLHFHSAVTLSMVSPGAVPPLTASPSDATGPWVPNCVSDWVVF